MIEVYLRLFDIQLLFRFDEDLKIEKYGNEAKLRFKGRHLPKMRL